MGMQTGAHIVWDWNGTLFHDNDAIIGATNAAFAEFGLTPITLVGGDHALRVPSALSQLSLRLPARMRASRKTSPLVLMATPSR